MDSPPRPRARSRRRAALQAVLIALAAAFVVATPGVPTGSDPRADAAGAGSAGGSAAAGGTRAAQRVAVVRNVPYGKRPRQLLDVHRPRAVRSPAAPGVLVVHGGGWRFGDKRRMAAVARSLAHAGLVAFNVNYSLATRSRPGFPMQLRELRAALRWVRRHGPSYGVDPRRIGALGSSAGAHLAALLGVTGSPDAAGARRLRAVVSWSAPFDLSALDVPALAPAVAAFVGCGWAECRRRAAASPLTHVDPGDPPMLMFASEWEFVPAEQARTMATQLAAAGVPHRLWVLPGAAHGIELADFALGPSIDFLRRRLR